MQVHYPTTSAQKVVHGMLLQGTYKKAAWDLYQWEGVGTPSMFCILEGSANMIEASLAGGRQVVSEPPTQLCGESVAWGHVKTEHLTSQK
jgi:hypothetical protein